MSVTASSLLPSPGPAAAPPLVFDLRAGGRSGIARVARETVAAYRAAFPASAVTVLTGEHGRYALQAQREWPVLRRAYPDAVWVWFHWDIPLFAPPSRSIVWVHDLIATDPALTAFPKRQVATWWIQRAVRTASRLVTVSEASAVQLREQFDTTATVIPNGVTNRWHEPWSPADYLLTVGEPRGYKNFALAKRVAARLGVRHRHAWGVADEALGALYAGARVVLIPSRAEGFGLPLLEAFGVGAPVVASDLPSLREVAGGLATHVSPFDEDGWCEAVRTAWEDGGDPEPRRAWAATFTWERAARQLHALACLLR